LFLNILIDLLNRLQDISDQITTNGCLCPSVFSPFTNLVVQQAVVSSRHIAFLLQVNSFVFFLNENDYLIIND